MIFPGEGNARDGFRASGDRVLIEEAKKITGMNDKKLIDNHSYYCYQ